MTSNFEENKMKILKFFHDTGEFYTMQELVEVIPKTLEISAGNIREIIEKLKDEDALDVDIFGKTICYWSFPSKSLNARKRKLEELERLYDNKMKRQKSNNDNESTKNIDEIGKILKEIDELKQRKEEIYKQLELARKNDPFLINDLAQHRLDVKLAINRWTDNLTFILDWCKVKYELDYTALYKKFKIPKDLDKIRVRGYV